MKKLLLVMALAALLCGVIYGIDYRPYKGTKTITMRCKTDSLATAGWTSSAYGSVLYDTTSVGYCNDVKSVVGVIRILASPTTTHNLGTRDTAVVTFRTMLEGRAQGSQKFSWSKTLDSAYLSVPCSLYVAHPALNGDTLFYHEFWITARIVDSMNDTAITAQYNVTYDLIGRGN